MKRLLLLMIAIGFAVFPSTALAQHNEDQFCTEQQECEEPPQECEGRCPVYIGILPTTTTTEAPTTTTTLAPTTTTAEVLGQEITQPPPPVVDAAVLPVTGGDVLGLTAIGAGLAAVGFGLTRARRRDAKV